METYEFLKEIYQQAKSTYEYLRGENYRLSFEKFKNFLWVNLAFFSAGLFFIRFFQMAPIEIYIFMFFNVSLSILIVYKISEIQQPFETIETPNQIGFEDDIKWIYEKVINHKQKEEAFYVELIREYERAIFQEGKRIIKNKYYYFVCFFGMIIQACILIFSFIKYYKGG